MFWSLLFLENDEAPINFLLPLLEVIIFEVLPASSLFNFCLGVLYSTSVPVAAVFLKVFLLRFLEVDLGGDLETVLLAFLLLGTYIDSALLPVLGERSPLISSPETLVTDCLLFMFWRTPPSLVVKACDAVKFFLMARSILSVLVSCGPFCLFVKCPYSPSYRLE